MRAMKTSFALALLITLLPASSPLPGGKKPNLLFIMADDLGWMDLACQGNPLVETPNLDRLAKQGMRFTDAYAAAPVCSPTRCAVLTGQAPARIGLTTHLPGRFFPKDGRPQPAELVPQLNGEHVTIAERMKEADVEPDGGQAKYHHYKVETIKDWLRKTDGRISRKRKELTTNTNFN